MALRLPPNGSILGLDIGDKRIGVAVASPITKLPRPLDAVSNDPSTTGVLLKIIRDEEVQLIIAGLPHNLEGKETAQSQKIREFVERLRSQTNIPIEFADETLSSVRAHEALRNAPKKEQSSVDSLAACFILDEFFANIE